MELINGRYHFGGLDVLDVAAQFGTPLYLYDGAKIVSQYEKLKQAFSGLNLKIHYAMKALSNINVLKLLKNAGAGLDAVSIQEVQIGLKAGFEPQEILYTPNGVGFDEIKRAVELGVQINIDNISILEQFGHEYEDRVPCCIRLNPHIMAGGNANIQVGHIDSKFGISIHQLRHVHRIVRASKIRVTGLHVHTGSEFLNASAFIQSADIIFGAAMEFEALEFIDFGSGFKVAYREGDNTTDVAELGQKLTEVVKRFEAEYGRSVEIWFEPGKYLVSEAGLLLVRVNVIKPTPATVFVGVDSGMNHLIRPMLYGAHHTIENASNPEGIKRIYTIVGYICETDTFGSDRKLSEVREGDIIAIKNAGAYGFSMANNYNSRYRPAEVLIVDGEAKLIREREKLEDLLRGQIEVV